MISPTERPFDLQMSHNEHDCFRIVLKCARFVDFQGFVYPAFAGWQRFDSSPGPWFYTLKSFGRNYPPSGIFLLENKSPGFSSENLRAWDKFEKKTSL
jgi:hypothetical protein